MDERELDRLEAIILSMTPAERANPRLIDGSRRKRIAQGSGTTVQAVNQLVKQFGQMRKMMSQLAKGKMPDPAAADEGHALSGLRPANLSRRMVRIRLRRVGSRKNPIWRVVVADRRSPRDGRTIETIGHYNPQTDPSVIVIDEERARHWLDHGAQPTAHGRDAAAHQGHRGLGHLARPARMRDLVEFLVRSLVADPDAVRVEEVEEDDGIAARGPRRRRRPRPRDRPDGRVANAIRTLAKAAATAQDAAASWSRSSRRLSAARADRRLHPVPRVVRVVRASSGTSATRSSSAPSCGTSTTATRRR